MSLLWEKAAAFQLQAEEEYPRYYTHVSPKFFRPGDLIRPRGRGWTNFDQSTGEHVYMTDDYDTADEIQYHLWDQGHPVIHRYDVEPTGEVEPDESMKGSYKTREPVRVLQRTDVFRNKPIYTSPEGKEYRGGY